MIAVNVGRPDAHEVTATLGIDRPPEVPTTQSFSVNGDGTLVFDEYDRIKYHIAKPMANGSRQSKRLEYLWDHGLIDRPVETAAA